MMFVWSRVRWLATLCALSVIMGSQGGEAAPKTSAHEKSGEGPRPQPLNLDQVSGVGFVQTLAGAEGLSYYRGVSPLLFTELTVGGSWIQREGRDSEYLAGGAIGLHFQLIQAGRSAALSLGARYQALFGRLCLGETDPCQAGAVSPSDIFEQSIDVPLRVWWFVSPYLSIHSEFGVTLQLGSGRDPITGVAPREGYQVDVFRNRTPFGSLGFTIWL